MKKAIGTLSALCFLLLLAGCRTEKMPEREIQNNKLSFSVDIEAVSYIEEAHIFTAKFMRFDEKLVTDALLQAPVTNTEIRMEGKAYIAVGNNQTEYLTVYDDGDAFGGKTGLDGGFIYGVLSEDTIYYNQSLTVIGAEYPDISEQTSPWLNRNDYLNDGNLQFKPKEEALAEITELFEKTFTPNIDVQLTESYNFDVANLRRHAELYAESSDEYDLPRMPEEKDEAYAFILRQEIDGIPVLNRIWEERFINEDMPSAVSTINAVYSQDGIIDFFVQDIVEILESKEKKTILSPEEAMKALQADFDKRITLLDTDIVDMELNYINVYVNNEQRLIPVWVFVSAQLIESDKNLPPEEQDPTHTEYTTLVFDASTGKRLRQAVIT